MLLFDLGDLLNLHMPIDVPDFLLALAGGFGDALVASGALPGDPAEIGYWQRFWRFLTRTEVELTELALATGVELRAALRQDPTFRDRLQERMSGHLGAFVADVRDYVETCRRRLGDREVVLLVDSVEQIRGTSRNAEGVQASVELLFANHADKLHLPSLHVVYTVPPYLKVRVPGVEALYQPGGLHILPAVKVRRRGDGEPYRPGLDALERLVARRGDWARLLGERAVLDELMLLSGGQIRDLLYLLREILVRARCLPVHQHTVAAAVDHVRNGMLPIPDSDVRWLHRIGGGHGAGLGDRDELPQFARFLDTHQVLGYLDGEEWYDIHPLIAERVKRQAAALRLASEDVDLLPLGGGMLR